MQQTTNNQQPLKGRKKWLKKAISILFKTFKIIYGLLKIFESIKQYFDDNP